MDIEALSKIIYELETSLMRPKVRQSAKMIQELISKDFVEFCSSGKIYEYKVGDVFDDKENSSYTYSIKDFFITVLSEKCILAMYRAVCTLDGREKHSLRSSIWRKENKKWKMIFHQGTLI